MVYKRKRKKKKNKKKTKQKKTGTGIGSFFKSLGKSYWQATSRYRQSTF